MYNSACDTAICSFVIKSKILWTKSYVSDHNEPFTEMSAFARMVISDNFYIRFQVDANFSDRIKTKSEMTKPL